PIDTSNLGGRAIKQVAAGYLHSLLLAADGSVFSCGLNTNGQTGLGTPLNTLTAVATPIDRSNLGGRAIKQVAAGTEHSFLLAAGGSVFSCGTNGNGRTGLGTDSGNTLLATPIDASKLGGPVTQVDASFAYSLLISVPEPDSLALVGAAAVALGRGK